MEALKEASFITVYIQTDRDKQTDRQTETKRQTETNRQRHTDRGTEREIRQTQREGVGDTETDTDLSLIHI